MGILSNAANAIGIGHTGAVSVSGTSIVSPGHTHAVTLPHTNQASTDGYAKSFRPDEEWQMRRLMMRMTATDPDYQTSYSRPFSDFEFIRVHKANEDKYYVFVVQGGAAVTLEDNALFPSDTLITQLRLIQGNKT